MKRCARPSKYLPLVVLGIAFFILPSVTEGAIHIENGVAHANVCSGTAVGVFCSGEFYTDVSFGGLFSALPTVFVTPNHMTDSFVGDGWGCVGSSMDALLCHAESVTKNGFRLYCSGSPQGGYCDAYGGWWAKASANWVALDNDDSVQSGHDIMPTGCSGNNVGSLCSTVWHTDVAFQTPFQTVPHVLASPEHVSAQGGCVGGSTDAVICYPSNITKSGFRLSCGGSPAWNACGDYAGYISLAKAGWLAKESTPGMEVQSGHGIETTLCDGSLYASGVCYGSYYRDVTFQRPFTTAPHVIVSPEHVSTGPACVGGGTDALLCEARNVTTTSFRAVCWGSPQYEECGYPDESGTTRATFGYMAIAESSNQDALSCTISFDRNSLTEGESTTIHWDSEGAELFYIENIGYVGASGDATVTPDATTDYSGYVNSKADGSGTTVQCTGVTALTVAHTSCPVGYIVQGTTCVFDECPADYIHQGNACIFSACPSGYHLEGTQCVADAGACTPGAYCQGTDLRDNCTDEVIEACAWGCFAGRCNPVPSPNATLKAVPSLVKKDNTTLVSWSSQYATACTVSGTNGDSWTGLSGSQTSSPIHSQTTYTLNCTGEEGADPSSVQKKAVVNIAPVFEEK